MKVREILRRRRSSKRVVKYDQTRKLGCLFEDKEKINRRNVKPQK